jgi:hypothetical protein
LVGELELEAIEIFQTLRGGKRHPNSKDLQALLSHGALFEELRCRVLAQVQ